MAAQDPEKLRKNNQSPEEGGVASDLNFNQNFSTEGQIGANLDKGKEKVDAPHAEGVFEHEFEKKNGYTIRTTNPKKKAEALAHGIKKQAEAEKEAEAIIKQALNEVSADQTEIDPAVAQLGAERDQALAGAQAEYETGMAQADQEEQLVAQETFAGVQEVMAA